MTDQEIAEQMTRVLMDAWLRHPGTRPGEWGKPDNVYFSVEKAVESITPAISKALTLARSEEREEGMKDLSTRSQTEGLLGRQPAAPTDTADLSAAITAVVRDADRDFERVGGSSRHWVRECFLPTLNAAGLMVTRIEGADKDTLCRHCNEELRLIDGDWCDRETHTTCLDEKHQHEPQPSPETKGSER